MHAHMRISLRARCPDAGMPACLHACMSMAHVNCTHARAGPRREEAKHINVSLYALGTVIERLSAAARDPRSGLSHVPFRNSKLTRLLQVRQGPHACDASAQVHGR